MTHVVGGVLEVAGIPGFLGNLDEMMEASDSEGAGWSAFIAAWWDRFGTAEVGAADLFDVALGRAVRGGLGHRSGEW